LQVASRCVKVLPHAADRDIPLDGIVGSHVSAATDWGQSCTVSARLYGRLFHLKIEVLGECYVSHLVVLIQAQKKKEISEIWTIALKHYKPVELPTQRLRNFRVGEIPR
jgi:hypothetical protein